MRHDSSSAGTPGKNEKIAASWASNPGVAQIVFKPDWTRHAKAAPFKAQRRPPQCPADPASSSSPAPASPTISPTSRSGSAFRIFDHRPRAR
ncbi:MAG: hypothetical protein R3C54_01800 [Parvularculaceae bacterium]